MKHISPERKAVALAKLLPLYNMTVTEAPVTVRAGEDSEILLFDLPPVK
ncbi:hypothetical protein [Dickeya dianthicola]